MKLPRISSTIIALIVGIFDSPMPGQASEPQAATSSKPNYQQVDGFQFEFLPIEFQDWKSERVPKLTIQENGTDIPFDIGPAHIKVVIRVKPSKLLPQSELENFGNAKIHLIPLNDPTAPNFDKAYPDLSSCRNELLAIFKGVIPKVKPAKYLPDWNCVDIGQTIHSKVRLVETTWCKGLQYITEYTQEETELTMLV